MLKEILSRFIENIIYELNTKGENMTERFTNEIYSRLIEELPTLWDGEECIAYMIDNGSRNWKQMEWPGFYFQLMCEKILSRDNFFEIPGKRYGRVEFDGFRSINFDFKAHSENANSSSSVPTNGFSEVEQAIESYSAVGFIIACGDVVYDEDGSFKAWHDELKGKMSSYEKKRISRGARSRRRKTYFSLKRIIFYFVDRDTLPLVKGFQSGMRNSNGSSRNSKVMIDLNDSRFEKYIYEVE